MADFTNVVSLPSRAALYTDIGQEVTIRTIRTKEEKLIFGSSTDKALDQVVQACISQPSNLDVNELLGADKFYLLVQLRILTYGSDYHVEGRCPSCNKTHEYKVDLMDMELYELDEDFVEPFSITLPVSRDVLNLRLLRGKDEDTIEKRVKRFKKRAQYIEGDPSYIFRIMQYITSVEGQELNEGQMQGYVENMHGQDLAYFWHKINSIKLGYDPEFEVTCANPGCGEEYEIGLPITAEFFRPRFKD